MKCEAKHLWSEKQEGFEDFKSFSRRLDVETSRMRRVVEVTKKEAIITRDIHSRFKNHKWEAEGDK